MTIENIHKSTDGLCIMCKGQSAEVNVTWQTSLGQAGGDLCECCAAMAWSKMVPGHMSIDTFTIVQIDTFDAAFAAASQHQTRHPQHARSDSGN